MSWNKGGFLGQSPKPLFFFLGVVGDIFLFVGKKEKYLLLSFFRRRFDGGVYVKAFFWPQFEKFVQHLQIGGFIESGIFGKQRL